MSSGKAFPKRILYSGEVAKMEFNPAIVEDFIEKTAYEDTYEEYLSLKEHSALIEAKDKEIERLKGLLLEVVDCPFTVDSATVPKIGIQEAPPYQVVVVLSMAWTRLQKIREALAGGKE